MNITDTNKQSILCVFRFQSNCVSYPMNHIQMKSGQRIIHISECMYLKLFKICKMGCVLFFKINQQGITKTNGTM